MRAEWKMAEREERELHELEEAEAEEKRKEEARRLAEEVEKKEREEKEQKKKEEADAKKRKEEKKKAEVEEEEEEEEEEEDVGRGLLVEKWVEVMKKMREDGVREAQEGAKWGESSKSGGRGKAEKVEKLVPMAEPCWNCRSRVPPLTCERST